MQLLIINVNIFQFIVRYNIFFVIHNETKVCKIIFITSKIFEIEKNKVVSISGYIMLAQLYSAAMFIVTLKMTLVFLFFSDYR